MSSIASSSTNRLSISPWLRVAVPISHSLRRFPGMGSVVDFARHARLNHLAKRFPERMTRYELDQLTAMAVQRRIISGPFKGLRYLKQAHGSVLSAKLLGTYELELHDWWTEVFHQRFENVWVIGSGEGYYAVGLAKRMHDSNIYAFDTDPAARLATLDLALLNHVADRLTIGGTCSLDEIAESGRERTLIVCDIEGAENELLTALPSASLSHSDLIVEVHDAPPSTKTFDRLLAHFANTHIAKIKVAELRNPQAVAWPPRMTHPRLRERLLNEGRYRGNRWIYFKSNCVKELH